jgi:Beta protein
MSGITSSFAADHYVPVLKVKRGEKAALSALASPVAARVTPLLEIVQRNANKVATLNKHFDTAFKDLADSVIRFNRCFLDVRELEGEGPNAASTAFQRAAAEGIAFTPVTGISRSHDVVAAMSHREHGVAVRITRQEFEQTNLAARIAQFLALHSIQPEAADLIVDLGAVENMIPDGVAALTAAFLPGIPHAQRWRTLTLSGCAFPQSMGGVGKHSHSLVDRAEWIAWRDWLYAGRAGLQRLPTFSDCAIQHPTGVEGFDPLKMQVSASARYATGDSWLLVKGESTRQVAPSLQFPTIARNMTSGALSGYFQGAGHCSGCGSIVAAAGGAPKLGSAEAWRRLGTIHHMTMVAGDLGALAWP